MGALRFYLALSVLYQHAPFWPDVWFMPAGLAVCSFFMVSGFYMQMVLGETYRGATLRFYANRALRLAPIYWAVLLLSVIGNEAGWLAQVDCCSDVDNILQPSRSMPLTDRAIGLFSNLTLLPAAIFSNITLFARANWPWGSLVFGQMYTVGLELMFYAIAPMLVRARGIWFAAILALAFVAHFAPYWIGLPMRPWQYEFFPSVLVFFMLGMASHRLYRWQKSTRFSPVLGWAALPVIPLYCFFVGGLRVGFTDSWSTWTLYLGVALLIPLLFAASRKNKIDSMIGDLSYPIYTTHFLVIAWVAHLQIADHFTSNRVVLVATLTLSIALYGLIEVWWVKRWRDRISGRITQERAPLAAAASAAAGAAAP